MKRYLLIILLGFTGVSALRAELDTPATAPTLPDGPLIQRPATDWRALITVTGPGHKQTTGNESSAAASAIVKRITIVHCGDLAVEATTETGGKTFQTWMDGPYRAVYDPVTKGSMVSLQGLAASGTANIAAEYPGFEWVSSKNFTGIEKVKGKEYIAFKDPAAEAVAYVDLVSRMPVSARQAELTYIYEFGTVPAGSVTLPPEIGTAINAYRVRLEVASRRPARPF